MRYTTCRRGVQARRSAHHARAGASMRIGLIGPAWVPVPPLAYGGLESVVDRLARGLARAGHDVLLAAPANSTCPVDLVPGMEDVPPDAPITGDTITELAHVAKAYAAMSG